MPGRLERLPQPAVAANSGAWERILALLARQRLPVTLEGRSPRAAENAQRVETPPPFTASPHVCSRMPKWSVSFGFAQQV